MISSKKSIVYIISNIDKALGFEWIVDRLNKERLDISFILLNPSDSNLENYLKKSAVPVYRIKFFSKKNLPYAILKICSILVKIRPHSVHCHLFEGSIAGLIASKLTCIKKRIYTRHHSTYHHEYFPKAVKYDRLINWLSTDIIAISENVKAVLRDKENVSPSKIHIIHHGFDINAFESVPIEKIESLRAKYNIESIRRPVIGVISRYIELKGIQFIVPAFKRLLLEEPNALLILANTSGNYKTEIKKLLSTVPSKNYIEINFENDLFSFYKVFDVFVHVPISNDIEAFGQTYIEALASGIPSVFTLSGVAKEFIEDKKNAIVVPFKNEDAIYIAIKKILTNSVLRKSITEKGFKDVKQLFAIEKTIEKLETLYLS